MASKMYAALSMVASKDDSIQIFMGSVEKSPLNPLFEQDKPWEPRLDNGYPNVIPPEPGSGEWRLYYGDCVNGCAQQILLFANSSDGLSWTKPDLGIWGNWEAVDRSDLSQYGKANNIVMRGGGLGVYRDAYDTSPGSRWKLFGEAYENGAKTSVGGTGVSAGGLVDWENVTSVTWPSPQRYDCHNNVFFDPSKQAYVATTRDGFSSSPGRAIGMAFSNKNEFSFDTSKPPSCVMSGTDEQQLYSMIPWSFHNIYLSIVMVYDAQSSAQKVHCRLAWSRDLTKFEWVDAGGLTGADFIPLGASLPSNAFDSHICFAAFQPVTMPDGVHRIYYMGGNGPHSGSRNSSFALATLRTDGYAGLRPRGTPPGTFTTVSVPCTGAKLLLTADVFAKEHSSIKSTSTAAPSVEYASVGSVLAGAVGIPGLEPQDSTPIQSNVTNSVVGFANGMDFAGLIGKQVTLQFVLDSAMVYTFGFQ